MKEIIGTKITNIFFNEDYLRFKTDKGDFTYEVDGDCCSTSVFYDFFGVKKLLENGAVTEVEEIAIHPKDIVTTKESEWYTSQKDNKRSDEDIKVYGFAITTISEEFGEMTSVVSFRNYSNGYYGGYLSLSTFTGEVLPEIFDDVLDSAKTGKND